jgi:hypothetical protein
MRTIWVTVSRNATWTWILAVTLFRIKAGQFLSHAIEPSRQLERILSLCYILNGCISLHRCCSLKLKVITHITFPQNLILKINIKVKLPVFNHHDMEAFLRSALEETEWPVSSSCRLTLLPYPSYMGLDGPHSMPGCCGEEKIYCLCQESNPDSSIVQPVV